jgi:hypothetical protein
MPNRDEAMTDFPTRINLNPPKEDKLTGWRAVLADLLLLLIGGGASAGFLWILVEEIKFGSRARAAEAVVVRSGILRSKTLGDRGVLVKSAKVRGTAVIVGLGWWNPPEPGERLPILYEPDREQIGPPPPAGQDEVMHTNPEAAKAWLEFKQSLELYRLNRGRDPSVELDSFWSRYFLSLFGLVFFGGPFVLVVIIRFRKILKWCRSRGVKQGDSGC